MASAENVSISSDTTDQLVSLTLRPLIANMTYVISPPLSSYKILSLSYTAPVETLSHSNNATEDISNYKY